MDAVGRGFYNDGASCDDQVVVGVDAVFIGSRYGKGTASVNSQIVVGENGASGIVRKGLFRVCFAACHDVFRPFRQGKEDLVGLVDADGRVAPAGQGNAGKKDPYLGIIVGVHDKAPVRQLPCHDIAAGGGDDHVRALYIGSASFYGGGAAFQSDPNSAFCVPAAVQVILRKPDGAFVPVGILVSDHLYAQGFPVHEEDCQKHRAYQNRQTDPVKVPV